MKLCIFAALDPGFGDGGFTRAISVFFLLTAGVFATRCSVIETGVSFIQSFSILFNLCALFVMGGKEGRQFSKTGSRVDDATTGLAGGPTGGAHSGT